MKRMRTPVAAMVVRMKRLPRRHRIAHLRALIARELAGALRREDLAALLRDEMTAQFAREGRAG
jgi:hypothetical protein